MADLRKLKDKAAELAARGKVEKAAEVFREILRADPRDLASCQKLAEVLRRGGEIAEAVERYAEVAERFARDGLLIKAIAICKTILELDPAHVHTQRLLADLYARRTVTDAARPPARTPPSTPAAQPPAAPAATPPVARRAIELPAVPEGEMEVERGVSLPLGSQRPAGEPTAFGSILAAADQAVRSGMDDGILVEVDLVDDEALELAPSPAAPAAAAGPDARLPRVPLFSDLGAAAFVALTEDLTIMRLAAGEAVITEGDEGSAFYVVATGRLLVKRRDESGSPVVLAHLGEGEFFGEMALLSGAPRNATVEAEEPSELLVIRAEVLRSLAGQHPHVAASLRRFYRQRLLANALAVSPLFRPFGRQDRKAVMERFRERVVRPGEVIVREGTPADGLYVVLEGALDVAASSPGTERRVGQLREGDLFGETSCLRKTGATATVTVKRGGSLLRLPRADLDALVMTYPTVLELMSRLSDERAGSLDAILSGSAVYAEDGLVLI
jgi:CRP-like cAMP-binding protein